MIHDLLCALVAQAPGVVLGAGLATVILLTTPKLWAALKAGRDRARAWLAARRDAAVAKAAAEETAIQARVDAAVAVALARVAPAALAGSVQP